MASHIAGKAGVALGLGLVLGAGSAAWGYGETTVLLEDFTNANTMFDQVEPNIDTENYLTGGSSLHFGAGPASGTWSSSVWVGADGPAIPINQIDPSAGHFEFTYMAGESEGHSTEFRADFHVWASIPGQPGAHTSLYNPLEEDPDNVDAPIQATGDWVTFELHFDDWNTFSDPDNTGGSTLWDELWTSETPVLVGMGYNVNFGLLTDVWVDSFRWVQTGAEVTPGDMNQDTSVNTGDVAAFVQALTDEEGYMAEFEVDDATRIALGDINGDSSFNTGDVSPFVDLLTGAGAQSVPEPGSLALLGLGGLMLLKRRRAA